MNFDKHIALVNKDMSAIREQIEKGRIRKLFHERKAGTHKWMKRQMNKYIRRNKMNAPTFGRFRPTRGWEF